MRIPGWLRVAFAMFVVGWGANQFTPLLLVYRATDHFSQTLVTAMFAAYALGLIPALLVSAEIGNRFGHRIVLRPVMVLAAVSSLLLATGESSPSLLFAGRVLYGVCTGAAMAPGTTWVKELSADEPPGTGARRAAIALSAGFGLGPLVAGLLAQWLPGPKVLPYAVHIALAALAGVLVWNVPAGRARGAARRAAGRTPATRHHALSSHFWGRVAPMAPWVFTAASVSLVVLPSLIRSQTSTFAVAFTGLLAGLTLGVGVVVQSPARSLEARRPGVVSVLGMAACVAGTLLSGLVVVHRSVPVVIVAAAVLGAGYGLCLVGGLTRVEHAASGGDLAMTNAVFYSLTYLGFFVPTLVALLSEHWPEITVLLGLAALAVLSLGASLLSQRAARAAA